MCLSAAGERFLGPARDLVAAGRRAADALEEGPARLAIGVTHHLVGPDLPRLLRRIGARETDVTLHLRVGLTRALMDLYDRVELDAAVVLRHDESRRDGEFLLTEGFGWFSAPDLALPAGVPLPLAVQPEPCSLRAMALRALDGAGVRWREAFVGTGAAAVGAAAAAGPAVALMARRAAPVGTSDVGPRLGLPPLPGREVLLHPSVTEGRETAALRAVAGAFRST